MKTGILIGLILAIAGFLIYNHYTTSGLEIELKAAKKNHANKIAELDQIETENKATRERETRALKKKLEKEKAQAMKKIIADLKKKKAEAAKIRESNDTLEVKLDKMEVKYFGEAGENAELKETIVGLRADNAELKLDLKLMTDERNKYYFQIYDPIKGLKKQLADSLKLSEKAVKASKRNKIIGYILGAVAIWQILE